MLNDRTQPENWRANGRGAYSSLQIPSSSSEWHDYQQEMWSAYLMEGYTEAQMAQLQLFLAYDEGTGANGDDRDTIGETVPVVGDFPLVINTGLSIVSGGILGLDDPHENSADLSRAHRIWKRSRWQTRKREPVEQALSMGAGFIESQFLDADRRTVLVPHDPRSVEVQYDSAGLNIDYAEITINEVRRGDAVVDQTKRILTPTTIQVERNGVTVAERSGPNPIGYVPLVHLVPFPVPGCDPKHGLSVAHAIRVAKAQVDSAFAQANAIGSRQGNPMLVTTGAVIRDNADNPMQLGRVLGLPIGADAKFLTSDPAAIMACLNRAKAIRASYIQALPEFYFASMGAGESGEARRIKAAALQNKYDDVRVEIYGGITEVTRMAVDMEAGARFERDRNDFEILAAPVLNPDVQQVVKDTIALAKENLITKADAVRQLQRVGYVKADADPDEYAALLEDNTASAARVFFGGGERTEEPETGAGDGEERTEDDDSADEMPEEPDE